MIRPRKAAMILQATSWDLDSKKQRYQLETGKVALLPDAPENNKGAYIK
jgi:hypothetical protein